VHSLWTNARALPAQVLSFNLHEFLEYCDLLRRLRVAFARHEAAAFHDACLFFLRGSHGLWAYLNAESDLRLRATVFGGLNHGPLRKPAFSSWLQESLTEVGAAGRQGLDLILVDEVDSGTGVGTQMNVIDAALDAWRGAAVDVRIIYVAVARPEHRDDQLTKTIEKWSERRIYTTATLEVTFDLLVGTLLAYDDDDLLGIARSRHGYRAIKHQGAAVVATCPCCCHQDCALVLATVGTQNETLASMAAGIASARTSVVVKNLDGMIASRGCPQCKTLWDALRPPDLARPNLGWRARLHNLRRVMCRWLGTCGHESTSMPRRRRSTDVALDELGALWLQSDSSERETRTARHGAGQAAAAWIIRNDPDHPPFDYIEVGTMAEHAGGVVPGGLKLDDSWFGGLEPLEQGAILLAGLYVQDGDVEYSREGWREVLDGLDGADGVDDYARAIDLCRRAEGQQQEFDEQVRERLASMQPQLDTCVEFIASKLKPGHRTMAHDIVAKLREVLASAADGGIE
jgi:hypothetical protein